MAEQEVQELFPNGPQLSEAITSFLYESLNGAGKNLVLRLRTDKKASDDVDGKEGDHTPPLSEPESSFESHFNVPYARNPDFVGRSGPMKQLFSMWKPGCKGRIAIVGLGGIGKTELMVEFTYRLQNVSPRTPVFWFRSTDLLTIPDATPNTSSATGMQLDQWLKSEYSPRSLLVVDPGDKFDDLVQPDAEKETLLNKLRSFSGHVVLLTRNTQSARLLVGPHDLCEIHDLEAKGCTTLLRNRLGPLACGSATELEDVAQLMAYLPRAILQIARVITSTGMTVSQFLQLYRRGDTMKLRLFSKIDRFSDPDQRSSVVSRGVFDLKAFRGGHSDPSRILYQLYYLGGTSVPENLFSAVDPLDMILTTFILKGHHLIAENQSNKTFTIHPLVYLSMHNILTNGHPEADEIILEEREWHEEIVATFADWYPGSNTEERTWWRDSFAHILGGCDLQSESIRNSIATIRHKESSYFKQRGRYSDALRMTLLAKSALPDPLPAAHRGISQDQIELQYLLGRFHEAQIALQGYSTEDEPSDVLWKRRTQAKLEQAEGANRYHSAVEIFHQVKTSREISGSSFSDLLQALDDYGRSLLLKGRYHDAASECRQALNGRTTNLGISHKDTLSSFHSMASILKAQGKYEDALHHAQQAVRCREGLYGSDHPDTLQSKIMKARILLSKAVTISDFDEAEALLFDSSNRLGGTLSESHPVIMACRSDRALIMQARGKYESAEQMNRTTLSTRQQGPWINSLSHPDTLTSKHQLAEIMWLSEGCRAADSLSEEVLMERTDVLTNGTLTGDDFHPDQLSSLQLRAIILSGIGEHLAAMQKIEFTVAGRRALLGEKHPDFFMALTWKGEIMRSNLPADKAERNVTLDTIDILHKRALDGLNLILGTEHQKTLQCATNLALAKNERGITGHAEAEAIYYQVYRSYRHSLGELHPETLKAKSQLADATRLANPANHQEAKRLWRESCGGFAKCFGVDAYLTVAAYKGYEKFLRTYPDS